MCAATNREIHPYVMDFIHRRGLRSLVADEKTAEITFVFDDKYRVKAVTLSPIRIVLIAPVVALPRNPLRHQNCVERVLYLSYHLFYRGRTTLVVDEDMGMVVATHEVVDPARVFDVEEALELFVNHLAICTAQLVATEEDRRNDFLT